MLLPANTALYPWQLNEISIEHLWNHTARIEDEIHTDVCLHAFAMMRKATVSFFVSVCLIRRLGTDDTLFFVCQPATKKNRKILIR